MRATMARREFLETCGAVLVGFSASITVRPALAADAPRPSPAPDQLDSFIALRPDGSFTAFFGKIDPGQGLDVAIAQIVAEELDVPHGAVRVVQGDTAQTVDQGGASASWGLEKGAIPLRYAAAEARRLLIERAASKLSAPAADLSTADGGVHLKADSRKRISYGALVGDGHFATPLQWNGQHGNLLLSRGKAEPKAPADYKLVGQSIARDDIRDNTFGRQTYVTDVRLPRMLHARVIRPPVVGAEPVSIDTSPLRAIPGVQVIHERGLVAVLAAKEWNAVRAAEALKVTWSPATSPLPDKAGLYDYLRTSPATARREEVKRGDVPAALRGAAQVVSAAYEWPFQSHASMGPACAVADVTAQAATVWTGSQKPHAAREGIAKLLGLPAAKVRVIWVRGPGSYGRNDAGDAAIEAAYLSRAAGRPVRLQYSRGQGTGWDPKGPASVHACRAGLDRNGDVVGFAVETRGFSRFDVWHSESDPRDTLPGQLLGLGQKPVAAFGVPEEPYAFPAVSLSWETVAPLVGNASPLRTAHLRDPLGPQLNFASECFIDELAAAAKADPVAFRLRRLTDPRATAVVEAAARRFGWAPAVAGSNMKPGDRLVRGRGFALAQRSATLCAVAVEVEVDRTTGAVRPVRWAVAHDCGLIVNPRNLDLTIEGNIVQSTSRALLEEVTFDRNAVTSVDWATYPILDVGQTPDRIDIVKIDRPDLPPAGAGEAATRPVAAAIGNAIFDATGVRLRRAPFTPGRVKAALRGHASV